MNFFMNLCEILQYMKHAMLAEFLQKGKHKLASICICSVFPEATRVNRNPASQCINTTNDLL